MKLITEEISDIRYLEEDDKTTGKKNLFVEGIFLQGNVKNKNNRWYPIELLDKEANRYNEDYIKKGRAFGELGHPDGPKINLDRVSHLITSLKREGNDYIGKARIIESTPYGGIVASIIGAGGTIGASSRAIGTLKMNDHGINEVQNDLYLATAADLVADPSAPSAFVHGIMESKEFIYANGDFEEQNIKQLKEQIDKAFRTTKDRESKLIKLFEQYLRNL
jgi:hypothetical protein